ncbi:hypothetical protein N7520_008020 [Penicillium odoratum]|uniref:uncharacterized protein n=1 Tax=Penicillium odoratum TaxID=1167516 RepID=UPI0025497FF6|nr:uncharacterized protein N7520_008020 [Penicillium odoratum]KAJ5760864.1 hypothetical protein N7520_008020 [Penicillium odoratum]
MHHGASSRFNQPWQKHQGPRRDSSLEKGTEWTNRLLLAREKWTEKNKRQRANERAAWKKSGAEKDVERIGELWAESLAKNKELDKPIMT